MRTRARTLAVPTLLMMTVLGAASPSPAAVHRWVGPDVNCLNARLRGHVVDLTRNHGADRRIFSSVLSMKRDLYVYLPPNYDPRQTYPLVLYLHSAFFDEHAFIASDLLVQLDHLIATGAFPPAIVACPDGLISGENTRGAPHSLYLNGAYGRFEDHILYEVLPFLERNYSIRPEREAHALLGISAGGLGAMSIGLRHRDRFGAVATLGSPLNMRYWNCQNDYRADFDPATYRWRTFYDPDEIIGIFYCGLWKTPAKTYVQPVLGQDPGVLERTIAVNPADQIFLTGLQPGQLAMYVNYGTQDNFNFDAQGASFAWLAAQRGVSVTVQEVPGAQHDIAYFKANHLPAYLWLGGQLGRAR